MYVYVHKVGICTTPGNKLHVHVLVWQLTHTHTHMDLQIQSQKTVTVPLAHAPKGNYPALVIKHTVYQ